MPEALRAAGVTRRETEVFWLVGDRLHNREIAERLHLSERTVESHVSALLGKLSAPTRQALVDAAARLRDRARARATRPRALSSFVGRDTELSELLRLVAAHRLVTLTGPAGAGKTRLALRLAALADSLPAPSLVDVAMAARGDDVERAFGEALGVAAEGSRLRSALREALGESRTWLLVDNCEHVAEAVSVLLADLLSAAPGLRVLATSQVPLRVPGEALYTLAPLELPPDSGDPAEILAAPSARLFADRAATASPGFEVTVQNARDTAELCRRLDGLPLAIELAAARVRAFSPAELLARLDDRFALLADGGPAGGRYLTLEAAIRWSHDLLDEPERIVLERCAVFPSEFDYDIAAPIVAFPPLEKGDLARLFPRLLDRSLLSATRRGESTTYRLLDSVHEFARLRLAQRGEQEVMRERHARHHIERAVAAVPDLQGRDQAAALMWFEQRWHDLRAAMRWAFERDDTEAAWRLLAGVGTAWDILGVRGELFDWLGVLLQGPPPAGELRARAAMTAVMLLTYEDAERAIATAEDARRDAGAAAADAALASLALGLALSYAGRPQPAVVHLERAAQDFHALGDDWHEAFSLQLLGMALEDGVGDGMPSLEQAADSFGRLGDLVKRGNVLLHMAGGAIDTGVRLADAQGWLDEGHRFAVLTANQQDLLHAEMFQARLDQRRGDEAATGPAFTSLIARFRRIGDRRCVVRCLLGAGRAAAADDDNETARRHLTECVQLGIGMGNAVDVAAALRLLARLDARAGVTHRAAVLLGAADAVAATLDAARLRGLPADADLRSTIEKELGRERFLASVVEGRGTPPADAVTLKS